MDIIGTTMNRIPLNNYVTMSILNIALLASLLVAAQIGAVQKGIQTIVVQIGCLKLAVPINWKVHFLGVLVIKALRFGGLSKGA